MGSNVLAGKAVAADAVNEPLLLNLSTATPMTQPATEAAVKDVNRKSFDEDMTGLNRKQTIAKSTCLHCPGKQLFLFFGTVSINAVYRRNHFLNFSKLLKFRSIVVGSECLFLDISGGRKEEMERLNSEKREGLNQINCVNRTHVASACEQLLLQSRNFRAEIKITPSLPSWIQL